MRQREHPVRATQSGGRALPERTQSRFESYFDRRLDHVQIHADARAARAAKSVHAKAFTIGRHIVFGENQYQPDTSQGNRLLAHELTHVIQQRGHEPSQPSMGQRTTLSTSTDPEEQIADRAADQFSAGATTTSPDIGLSQEIGTSSDLGLILHRDEEDEEREVDFQLIPPEISVPMGRFDLSADTSRAQLGYRGPGYGLQFGYQYGSGDLYTSPYDSNLEGRLGHNQYTLGFGDGFEPGGGIYLGGHTGDFASQFAFNPSSLAFGAEGSYGGFAGGFGYNPEDQSWAAGGAYGGFNLGINGTGNGGFGASFGYGAPLLPMPWHMANAAYPGAAGVEGVTGALPNFPQDPIGTIQAQQDNIGAISDAARTFGPLASDQNQNGVPFGAGLQYGWDPVTGHRFMLGAQGSF